MNAKRIAAIAALLLIIVMYAATLIAALTETPGSDVLLRASIFCTVVIPVMIYGFTLISRGIRGPRDSKEDDSEDTDQTSKKDDSVK